MKKIITLLVVLTFSTAFAQRTYDQYSLEGSYGLSHGMSKGENPNMTDFQHFDVGFRYMFNEYWGVKVDFGHDAFRTDEEPSEGTDYSRFSVQGVYNIGRALDLPYMTGDWVNVLGHAGLGYSALISTRKPGTDNIGNVIVGLTPQFWISEQFAIHVDASYVLNFTQHYNFDGTYPPSQPSELDAFMGGIINFSAGLTFYFGKNGNDSDWR
ncbi:MAG: outer membrane beta-barrel protein [Flavobacterium sp.]